MKSKDKIKILICDDHNLVREGIVALLKQIDDIEVVGEASNGIEAIQKIKQKLPDVVLMDLSMPKLDGLKTTVEIRKKYPEIKIIILTQYENEEYIVQMLKAGANGYVLKNSIADDLIRGIREVMKGEKFFSSSITKIILEEYVKKVQGLRQENITPELTNRELEVLKLIAEGYSNQETADKLFISVRTVEFHRANIMHKLKIKDLPGLVKYAIQKGIISIENIKDMI